MKKYKDKSMYLTLAILLLLIGVGYAVLNANLTINGTSGIANATWDVHFENPQATANSSVTPSVAPAADPDDKVQSLSYTVSFDEPGQVYEFKVYVANRGSIDAMIDTITSTYKIGEASPVNLLENDPPAYLDYYVTYSDDLPLANKQRLVHGTVEELLVHVEFKRNITNAQFDEAVGKTITFNYGLNYIQADGSETTVNHPLCRRATTLHTTTCTWDSWTASSGCDADGYTAGNKGTTITYGQLGTKGNAPVSGDAFDCDVNADGVYDPATERFYYVSNYYDTSTKSFDNTKATLIYYTNVTNGVASSDTFAYDTAESNLNGPVASYENLPATTSWKNPLLIAPGTRQILTDTATTTTTKGTINQFTYTGRAARLLTTQELASGCNIAVLGTFTDGELDSCKYLLENTIYQNYANPSYGFWLESPNADYDSFIWATSGTTRVLAGADTYETDYMGIRPVITVLKTNIAN